ncbi:MAG: hypothetical protein AAFY17_15590 [Cyanobacteria bacterium J06642_11]
MFIPSLEGAPASIDSLALSPTPSSGYDTETVRHLLFGSLSAVQSTIRALHKRGYAEPNDWSKPISTGRPNEVMAILTKRIRLDPQP